MVNNLKLDFLSPVQENEFLPPIDRWMIFSGLFILCVLGLAIPVASLVKYKVTVKSNIVIRPIGELRIVQAAIDGQVMHIFVQENQVIKKGDVIARIDDSHLQMKKSIIQSNIQQSKLQLVQINLQVNTIDSQIKAESDRSNHIIASAKAQLIGSEREYRKNQITTDTAKQEADINVNIAYQELYTAQAQLKSALANLRSTQAALGAAKSKQNRYASAAKVGALSQDLLEETLLAVQQQEQAVETQKAAVEAQVQTIKRLKQAVSASVARQRTAIAALNPTNAEVKLASARIAQEKASRSVNQANLAKERQALIKQQIEIQQQLKRDSYELEQVEIELKQTTITSTADGIVFRLNLRNPGQTLRVGEELVQIVPTNTSLVAKAAVASDAKSKLKIGQKVDMRIRACPYPDFGTLKGEVKSISPDIITPKNNDTNDTTSASIAIGSKITQLSSFYEVIIEPRSKYLGTGNKQCSLELGMDGTADIISKEETVLQFFLRKARIITNL